MNANLPHELTTRHDPAAARDAGVTALLAMATAAAWLSWLGAPVFPMDDAYIVQHAVLNLHSGVDPRFGGTPLNGATSLVHVLVVWLLGSAMPVAWAQFGVAASAWTAWLVGVQTFAGRHQLPAGLRWAVVTFAGASGFSFYQAFNGLETGLAMAACMWLIVLFDRAEAVKPGAYVLVGLLPFIRPELGLLAVLVLLRQWRLVGLGGMPTRGWLCLVAPVLWVLAFSWRHGGGLLPGTVAAKTHFFAEGCLPADVRWRVFVDGLEGVLPGIGFGLGLIGFAGLLRLRQGGMLSLYVIGFIYAYFERFPGAVSHNHFRYLHLLLPVLVAGWVGWLGARKYASRTLLIAPMAVCLVATLPHVRHMLEVTEFGIRHTRVELEGVNRWVAGNLPPDAVLLVHDAGYISMEGSQALVDLVGLKTPWTALQHKQHTWTQCRRDTPALSEIALQSKATHFVVLTPWDEAFNLTGSLKAHGWRLERVDRERVNSAYRIYRIDPPVITPAPPPS